MFGRVWNSPGMKDTKTLQDDLNKFSAWEDQWHMKFHAKECVVLTVSCKKNPIQADPSCLDDAGSSRHKANSAHNQLGT